MSAVKLLVVDDEPDLRHLVRQRFRHQVRDGIYDFSYAADGEEALLSLRSDPAIDIVLTDINMPRMDGLTLLSRMDDLNRLLMPIVVSAYGDMDNIRVAMNRGSFDFLTKPIDLQDLEITIGKAVQTIQRLKVARQVQETFGRYLSAELIEEVLTRQGELQLGGEARTVSLLMSDVRGFSSLSADLAPERVVEMLNLYLGCMVDVIAEHNGVIDNFIGDGILVLFGAPIQRPDDARRAVACALAMQRAMVSVNHELAERNLPRLEMGIGVDTGRVVVGNIGSRRRMKYSVVGSHVNLVSRIESHTVGGQVLVSESTCASVGTDIVSRDDMRIMAKGFRDPVRVVDVIGLRDTIQLDDSRDPAVPLAKPVECEIQVIDGKRVGATTHVGLIRALSSDLATVSCQHTIDPFTNVVLLVAIGSETGDTLLSGKVIARADQNSVVVQFAGLGEDLRGQLKKFAEENAA